MIDLFGGDLPDTISEATEQLSEAGLLEVVSDIIQNNPEASEAIYGVDDGAADARCPLHRRRHHVGAPRGCCAGGCHLLLRRDRGRGSARGGVLTIDPLTGAPWTVRHRGDHLRPVDLGHQDIVLPAPVDLPEGINWSVYPQGLVANDNGWVLPVYRRSTPTPTRSCRRTFSTDGCRDGFGAAPPARYHHRLRLRRRWKQSRRVATFTWDELGVDPEVPTWSPRRTTRRRCGLRRGTACPPSPTHRR